MDRVQEAIREMVAWERGVPHRIQHFLKVHSFCRYIGMEEGLDEATLRRLELAAVVHFHPNYFISFFKKYFGTSPLKYVNEARLNQAKRLLKSTDESVAQIAEETGFRDLYHFSKRFKASTGYSPSDFRKL